LQEPLVPRTMNSRIETATTLCNGSNFNRKMIRKLVLVWPDRESETVILMKWQFVVTFGLFVFVMIFAVQNAADVDIKLLFWHVNFPRSLLIFMMLMIGMIIGWFARSLFRISRKAGRGHSE
jgi:uncharacterized integral membrane protein